MTKEELTKENEKLKLKVQSYENRDERLKKEFAKIFNFYKPHSGYGNERLVQDISWETIFTEVGKLLAARTFYDLEGNVSEIECAIEKINKRLEEINPTLN